MARTTRYRFRTPSDRKLLESILWHKPHAAPYGSKAGKWNLICADLIAFEHSTVAPYRETKADQLTARACRNRFKILKVDYPLRYGKYCTAEQKEVLALLELLHYEAGHSDGSSSDGSVRPSSVSLTCAPVVVVPSRNSRHPPKKKTAMEFILNSAPSDDDHHHQANQAMDDEEEGDTTSNDSHDLDRGSISSIPRSIRSSSDCSSVYSNYDKSSIHDDEKETLSLEDVLREFKALRETVTTLIETKKQWHRHEHHHHHAARDPALSVLERRMMIPQLHQYLPTARTTSQSPGHRVIQ